MPRHPNARPQHHGRLAHSSADEPVDTTPEPIRFRPSTSEWVVPFATFRLLTLEIVLGSRT
jgi:hypothetical protein